MMKQRTLALLAAFLLLLPGCAVSPEEELSGIERPIYFLAPSGAARGGDALISSDELLDLEEDADVTEIAFAVVERLLRGSQNGDLLSPFPKDTQLLSLSIRSARAYVDFSGIQRMEGIDLTLADYCLTLSLTALEGIDSVTITSNGRLMLQQPRRVFYAHDVLLSSGDSVMQQVQVSLYFLDASGMLTFEKRTLDIYEGETQSSVLLAALLSGPKSSNLHSIIPKNFSVNSIRVEDGVCRISLPTSVLQTLPPDEYSQKLILWSITESLYSLDYIEQIRLIVDGEELERFGLVPVASISERPQG